MVLYEYPGYDWVFVENYSKLTILCYMAIPVISGGFIYPQNVSHRGSKRSRRPQCEAWLVFSTHLGPCPEEQNIRADYRFELSPFPER